MSEKYDKSLRILGLNGPADLDGIKSAYRKLVKIHHPDLFKKPENKAKASHNFKVITEAFEYLKDNYIPPEEYKSVNTDSSGKKYASSSQNTTKKSSESYESDTNDTWVNLIKMCIEKKIMIKIRYRISSLYGESETERVICPLGLYLGSELKKVETYKRFNMDPNRLYLHAYCGLRKDYRTFRLDRIVSAEACGSFNDISLDDCDQTDIEDFSNNQGGCGNTIGCLFFIVWVIILLCSSD